MSVKLSILICAIPSRWEMFRKIFDKLDDQATDEVQVLGVIDNKKFSIGGKRDALKQIALGQYMTWVDDDDDVSEDYVSEILKAIEVNPDVITFQQKATINDQECIIDFDINNENDQFVPNTVVKRKPFPMCVFRSELAKKYSFPDSMYGEDWKWAEQVLRDVKTQVKIDKILHYYNFRSDITEAC